MLMLSRPLLGLARVHVPRPKSLTITTRSLTITKRLIGYNTNESFHLRRGINIGRGSGGDIVKRVLVTNAAKEKSTLSPTTNTNTSTTTPITTIPSKISISSINDDELRWKAIPTTSLSSWPGVIKELSKGRLAALVVLTTMCGYALAPGATNLATLFWTTTGTALCVGSANAINQWLEVPFDAQMARTRKRALVRRACSPLQAFTVGTLSGLSGATILWTCVNPTTAVLGAANILLYTAVYTPMKRRSIANTWIGAVVGAIPPIMGWSACTGGIELPALALGAVLYAWQFPHFNSLSYLIRAEYAKAGYHMTSILRPSLNTASSLRNCLLLLPIGALLPALDVTTWWFAADVTLVNLLFSVGAWRFWRNPNNGTARKLFFASLVYLPIFFGLTLLHKKADDNKV